MGILYSLSLSKSRKIKRINTVKHFHRVRCLECKKTFNDRIKILCFLMALSHSRLLYIEFTRSDKFDKSAKLLHSIGDGDGVRR